MATLLIGIIIIHILWTKKLDTERLRNVGKIRQLVSGRPRSQVLADWFQIYAYPVPQYSKSSSYVKYIMMNFIEVPLEKPTNLSFSDVPDGFVVIHPPTLFRRPWE